MNKVQILGTITRDVELRYTQSGSAIANFGIAYNDKWKDQSGQVKEKAHFFDVSAFGKKGEALNQYFSKGQRILIDGSLDFQQWEKDGQKHSKVSIKLDNFDFIERKDGASGQQQGGYQAPQQQQQYQPPAQQQQQPQVQYQNQQGQQVSQQQYQHQQTQQQPQYQQQQRPSVDSVPVIDIDEESIPF